MKRIFASIAIVLTAFNSPVYASVGGPFDNGLFSASLDRNSIYQAILTFGDGSGFCYFTPTANLAANGTTTGGGTSINGGTSAVDTRGSITNRMVVYYKGLTYFGSAFGTADNEARSIVCTMNGSSNSNQTTVNSSSTSVGLLSASTTSTGGSSNPNAASTIILSNAASFTVNGDFTAHIDQTAPTMRFSGEGELSFIAPTSKDAVAGLALTGYAGLVNSIVTAVGNANVGANFNAGVFTTAQAAINSALAALALTPLTTINSNYQTAQVRHLSVYGTRRYL